MTDKLRECPFCGGENVGVFKHHFGYKDSLYTANCYDCHFGLKMVANKEESIEAWNTRKPMDRIVEQLEELTMEHPYKVVGEPDTYSQYNEAWSNCCDRAEQIVKGGAE